MIKNISTMKTIVRPLPLAKLSYETIRNSILNGSLKSGEVYNEMKLAEELGISRTPVREALLELAVHGLVTFLPRRGIRINSFTKSDVEDIFELRKAIELAVMDKIVKRPESLILSKIDKIIDLQQKAAAKEDMIAFLDADRLFHTTFAKLAGNKRMVIVLENLRDIIHLMGSEALVKSGRMDEVVAEHKKILELIRKGKAEEAKKALADHLDRSIGAVLNQHDLFYGRAKGDP